MPKQTNKQKKEFYGFELHKEIPSNAKLAGPIVYKIICVSIYTYICICI